MNRDRFGAWLGSAIGAHALVTFGATLFVPSDLRWMVQRLRADQRAHFTERFDVGVAAPPQPAEPPLPPSAGVEAPPITPAPPAPVRVRPPASPAPLGAPLREVLQPAAHRLFQAAAGVVAEAGKVLTREDEAGGDAIVSGNSSDPTYGLMAGAGQGNAPTTNQRAPLGGGRGGRGESTAVVTPPEPDLTRRASAPILITNECEFPPEADFAGIDNAVVILIVTVKPDGHAGGITVLADPGHGFGRAAMTCAQRLTYVAARDRHGTFLQADTKPFNLRFAR